MCYVYGPQRPLDGSVPTVSSGTGTQVVRLVLVKLSAAEPSHWLLTRSTLWCV